MSTSLSLQEVQDATLAALTHLRDEVNLILFVHDVESTEHSETLKRLVRFMSERAQAAMHLVSVGYAWDAEIVLRSFYEASVKIVFLCRSEKDSRPELMNEFWRELGSVYDKRRAIKAEHCQNLFKRFGKEDARVFAALRDPRSFDVEDKVAKARRQVVEQKWSFSELLKSLEVNELQGRRVHHAQVLLHMYGIASSLLHCDSAALDLMLDRELRDPSERRLLEASHATRIFSDLVFLSLFVAESLRENYSRDFQDQKGLLAACEKVHAIASAIGEAFNRIQDPLYRSHEMSEQ